MSECEQLKKLVEKEGYQPYMILREPSMEELKKKSVLLEGKIYALPLRHKEKGNIMFYFNQLETLSYAKKLVEDQRTIIGYDPTFYLHAIWAESHRGRKLHFGEILRWLEEETRSSVVESSYPNTFEIKFSDLKDTEEIRQKKVELEFYISILSIKTGIGFVLNPSISEGAKYKGQPFSIRYGLEEENVRVCLPTNYEINSLKERYKDKKFKKFTSDFKNFYLQPDPQMKVIVGASIIESEFSTPPQALLSINETNRILTAIKKLIPEDKFEKFSAIVRNKNIVSKKTKRERLIESISQRLNIKYEDTKKMIDLIYEVRGKNAHSVIPHKQTDKAVVFIESILQKEFKRLEKDNK